MGKRRKDKKVSTMIGRNEQPEKRERVIDVPYGEKTVTFSAPGPALITHVRLYTGEGTPLADVPVNRVMNTGDTISIPAGALTFPSAEEVKGCTASYDCGDLNDIYYCRYDEGHDRVKMEGKNRTLFDHGDPKHGIWWNASSRFHRPGTRSISTHLDGTADDDAGVYLDTPGTGEVLPLATPGSRELFGQFAPPELTGVTVAESPADDMVNHPAHYGGEDNPYEAIKVIEAWELGFCLGNAVKYISRADRKGSAIQDLEKAEWYLRRQIELLKAAIADPEHLD